MILEGKTDTILLEDGEDVQESTKMEIDADSHIFLMRMLSKFYSDGVGSLIRETASNALDSHRECGVDEPIIVSFKKNKDGNYEFSVQDFGCGLDNNDVENIIKKYGKSTKRNSDTQLGAFGLGFKSPLAYTSSFYFIGRKEGIERKWMLYESDDESNKIDLLYESPTEERNGVKVIVSVKYSDRGEFFKKIKQQLSYFENVYFECDDYYETIKNEEIKIVRSEHFQWSNLTSDSNMHICLDNVYYPIDYDKLGISKISFPVGLRFSLKDGLFPIPNREQLKYTKEAKEIILNKIKKVADYFVSKYNESIKDSDDIFTLFSYYSTSSRYVEHFDDVKGNLDIQYLKSYSTIPFMEPKLNNIKYLTMRKIYDIKDYLLGEYVVKYYYSNGRFNLEKENNWRSKITIEKLESGVIHIFSDMGILKKAYLRDTFGYSSPRYFIKKEKPFKLGSTGKRYTGRGYDNYTSILGLHSLPKSEWRDRIKELQYIISLLTKGFVDTDKIEIPQDWLDGRKKERVQKMVIKGTNIRRKKLTGEVTGKVATHLERYVSGKNCKFVTEIFQMKDAHKDKRFIIYGGEESEPLFQKLYTVLVKKSVKLVILSQRELKNLKEIELHNWMEIGKFMEGKHKIFRRAVTSYLIHQLHSEFPSVFRKIPKVKEISTVLGEKLDKLNDYNRDYYLGGDEELYKSMLSIAEEHKLYDTSIYDVYKEVEFILDRLPFIEPMFSRIDYTDDGYIKAIRDLFKYYKQRMDWRHYNLPINEEIIEEVVETEEILDEN